MQENLIIFTDGASKGNPGPGGYGAVVVYPKLEEIIELGGGKPNTTNNVMELTAVIAALSYVSMSQAPTIIYTDSKYVVQGITGWVHGWERNGWMTQAKEPVKNKELWQQLHSLVQERQNTTSIEWVVTPSHVGVTGNERADAIASGFAEGNDVPLYQGTLAGYGIKDILTIPNIQQLREEKRQTTQTKNQKAYIYLSVVDGVLERHETWPECEARVKGKNASFRKAISPEHETEIIAEWKEKGVVKENT